MLSKLEKALFFLKSSNKEVEHMIRIIKIEKIERDLRDHRNISVKVHNLPFSFYIIFSSVYKVIQFLEIINNITSIYPMVMQAPEL